MGAKAQPGIAKTLIDLPVPLKDQIAVLAQSCGSTSRLEIIAAMQAWLAKPDPRRRQAVIAAYDRRNTRGTRP
jgi:hypothetical protein